MHISNDTDMHTTTSFSLTTTKGEQNFESSEPLPSLEPTHMPLGFGSTQRLSVNTVAEIQHSPTIRLEPSSRLETSSIPLEPSGSGAFSTVSFKSGKLSTQSIDYYDNWQTPASIDLISTPLIPIYLQSGIRDQISASPIYSQQVNSMTVEDSMSRDWLYPISPSLTTLEASASSTSTIPSTVKSYSSEGVTNYPGFEEQRKNNTVATVGSDLNTMSDILEQTTLNTKIDISKTQTEESTLNSTGNLMQTTTTNTLLEPIIETNNGDYVNTQTEIIIETTTTKISEPLPDNYAATKGLSESDLMFRFNLYGPSGSKNYLRFPIVTGSNGKFLFSPLSNKDSIDIEAKNSKNKNLPAVQVVTASDSVPASSDIKQLTGVVQDNTREKVNAIEKGPKPMVIEKGPKPMVIDWKTPPTAKPTSFPDGWNVKTQGLEKEGTNGSPSGPKVIFSISKRSNSIKR